jgi:hypothetical protein
VDCVTLIFYSSKCCCGIICPSLKTYKTSRLIFSYIFIYYFISQSQLQKAQIDPISIIGLASSIISFIDFGIELVSYRREIHSSVRRLATQNATLEKVIEKTQAWCSNLRVTYKSSLPSPEERAIVSLTSECKTISDEILVQLKKIKPEHPKSKLSIAIAIIKDKWHNEDRTKLQNRLEKCQSQSRVQLETLDRFKSQSSLSLQL